jgi:hypothetical protein
MMFIIDNNSNWLWRWRYRDGLRPANVRRLGSMRTMLLRMTKSMHLSGSVAVCGDPSEPGWSGQPCRERDQSNTG